MNQKLKKVTAIAAAALIASAMTLPVSAGNYYLSDTSEAFAYAGASGGAADKGTATLCSNNYTIPDTAKEKSVSVDIISMPSTEANTNTGIYEITSDGGLNSFVATSDIYTKDDIDATRKSLIYTEYDTSDKNGGMTITEYKSDNAYRVYSIYSDFNPHLQITCDKTYYDKKSNTLYVVLAYGESYSKDPYTVHTTARTTNICCLIDCSFAKNPSSVNIKIIKPSHKQSVKKA